MFNKIIEFIIEGIVDEIHELDSCKNASIENIIKNNFKDLFNVIISLIDSIEEGIVVINDNQEIIECNKAFLNWLNLPKEEVLNKTLSNFVEIDFNNIEKNFYIKDTNIPIKATLQEIEIKRNKFKRLILQNLKEFHKFQRKLKLILKMYKALNLINQEIIRAHKVEEIYENTAKILVNEKIFDFVWIGEVKNKDIVLKYSYGDSAITKKIEEDIEKFKKNYIKNVIATNEPFETDKLEKYEKLYEYKISIPIFKNEYSLSTIINHSRIRAVMVGYFKDKTDFDPHLINLLKQVAHDMGYAINMIISKENIEYLAYYDILTNLPNRRFFLEQLDSVLKILHQKSQYGVLVLIDIDNFKKINESLGYHLGDLILINIKNRLKELLTPFDLIARIGSDEFAIFLTKIKNENELFHILKEKLNNFEFLFEVDSKKVLVTLNVGVAFFPKDAKTKEDLFAKAEKSLNESKKSGKRFYVYNSKLDNNMLERIEIESELMQAIENDEFEMYYQPIIDIKNKKIYSFEALLRWISPKRGVVSPVKFIPILEETGLINEVGGLVLNKVCDFLEKTEDVKISINISVKQLLNKNFIDDLLNNLKKYSFNNERLIIEITESMLMENINAFIYDVFKLNAEGIEVEIDDFGTGYSSLAYLKRLPVDALKIDKTFIKDIVKNVDDLTISTAIINLGHTLGKKIIAEGVENERQFKILKDLNCDYLQGYYFAKPMPENEAFLYLKNSSYIYLLS